MGADFWVGPLYRIDHGAKVVLNALLAKYVLTQAILNLFYWSKRS
jgi:hypothetical protein